MTNDERGGWRWMHRGHRPRLQVFEGDAEGTFKIFSRLQWAAGQADPGKVNGPGDGLTCFPTFVDLLDCIPPPQWLFEHPIGTLAAGVGELPEKAIEGNDGKPGPGAAHPDAPEFVAGIQVVGALAVSIHF